MRGGDIDVVGPAHQAVADIDDEGARHDRGGDPFAAARPDLQAADIVGGEQGDVAVVGVLAGADPVGRVGGVRGIMQQAQRRHRPVELVLEERVRQSEIARERAVQPQAQRRAIVEIA